MEIHSTMAFRWTGYGIEMGDAEARKPAPKRALIDPRKPLDDSMRSKYLGILSDAFDPEKGLLASPFSPDDRVGKREHRSDPLPCLFFTEQAAGDAVLHWRRYGRLGFGISKRVIFNHGGMPVIYTGSRKHRLEQSIDALRRYFEKQGSQAPADCHSAIEYLARMVKPTRMPTSSETQSRPRNKPTGAPKRQASSSDPVSYPAEQRIRFLDEREWRLLHDRSSKAWRTDASGRLWFRPQLGKELQLIILPDNQTLHLAIECDAIRSRLVAPDRPPVQLLTAEALQKL